MPKITIFTGSILDTPCKTYVISIGENRILQGETAIAMLEKFGEGLQTELLSGEPFKRWECRLVKREGYNLIFGRPFDYEIRQLTILGVESVIRGALKICDKNNFRSLAIPALTLNYLPKNEQQINDITHLAIDTYFNQNPSSQVDEIFLVNFGKEVFRI